MVNVSKFVCIYLIEGNKYQARQTSEFETKTPRFMLEGLQPYTIFCLRSYMYTIHDLRKFVRAQNLAMRVFLTSSVSAAKVMIMALCKNHMTTTISFLYFSLSACTPNALKLKWFKRSIIYANNTLYKQWHINVLVQFFLRRTDDSLYTGYCETVRYLLFCFKHYIISASTVNSNTISICLIIRHIMTMSSNRLLILLHNNQPVISEFIRG